MKSVDFALNMYGDLKRKFTNEPYRVHPIEVAELLKSIGCDDDTVMAGVLHDVVEDTNYTHNDIKELFNDRIAYLVHGMTKTYKDDCIDKGAAEYERFSHIFDPVIHTIKLADIYSNLSGYKNAPKSFLIKFVKTKETLLPALSLGDESLYIKVSELILKIKREIHD